MASLLAIGSLTSTLSPPILWIKDAFKLLEAVYADIMSSPIVHSRALFIIRGSRLLEIGRQDPPGSYIQTRWYIVFHRQSFNGTVPLWSDIAVPFEFKKTNKDFLRKDVRYLSNLGLTCSFDKFDISTGYGQIRMVDESYYA